MSNGLAIYDSQLKSVDGSRGIIAGPHKSFNKRNGSSNHAYLTNPTSMYFQMQRPAIGTGPPGTTDDFKTYI